VRAQLAAVVLAVAVAAVVFFTMRGRAWFERRRSRGMTEFAAGRPQILYFSTRSCTTCRTKQEPALAELGSVMVTKLDAVHERDVASRFHVYTVPSTVVVAGDGTVVDINYGFAPASRLASQIARAEKLAGESAA
jgi:thioredoxin-like negative regulator of GroEL